MISNSFNNTSTASANFLTTQTSGDLNSFTTHYTISSIYYVLERNKQVISLDIYNECFYLYVESADNHFFKFRIFTNIIKNNILFVL